MFYSRCDLVFELSKIAIVCFNRMQEDTFVPNLVQIGRETAEESWLEKKKRNRQKNIILPKFWKIAFLQKRKYKNHADWNIGYTQRKLMGHGFTCEHVL